ncbi:dihydrofolate reductase [Rhizobium leguminosarum]|uniref:dihydrofolate reductase n=1 Tax=Rhizobium leguminosarum TaxID=384 RepID=UPI003F983878
MKPIVRVAAMDAARAIGRGNQISWHIPGGQKRFKELTMGKPFDHGAYDLCVAASAASRKALHRALPHGCR